jgi:glycosyltransferase involved in cell wall biosynthesis
MRLMPRVSVVLPTYNRAVRLERALNSVLEQTADAREYEVIVVDNNSTDDTAQVIGRLQTRHPDQLRNVVERTQGVSHARNTGIAAALAPIVAFFDDDVRVAPNWIETIIRVFADNPGTDVIGGKVLPEWATPPPGWLTPAHWAPLALQDFGDRPMLMSARNPRGLISANLACRKRVFDRVGGFSPVFQRVKDGIGSLEDDEWNRRLWDAGLSGLYLPDLVASTDVPGDRLTRDYHRRWHSGHGRFYALLRAPEMETSGIGSLWGVPAHLYRSSLAAMANWASEMLRGRPDEAFVHEVKLRFFRGFLRQRITERFYS